MSLQIVALAFSLCVCLAVSKADGEASGLCSSPVVHELLDNLTSHYSEGVTQSLETSALSSALNCSLQRLDCGQSCQCLELERLCEDADCGTSEPEVLTVEQYERTSVVLLYHLLQPSEACSNHSDSSRMKLTSYDQYVYWFMPNGTNITDTLDLMFDNLVELTEDHDDHDEVEDHEDHDDHDEVQHDDKCINDKAFDHLFEDVDMGNLTVEYISGRAVLLIFQGYRFAHICDKHDVTPDAIYEHLLSLLGIENEFDKESLCELMGRLGIGGGECTMDDHDHDDDDDNQADHDDHDHRKRREAGHLIQKRQADMATIECLTVDDILSIYQITSPRITQSDVERLCPALLEQHLSGTCAAEEEMKKTEGPTRAERYGYSTVAVAFITLCAIFGILLILCKNRSGIKDNLMACLIALAVGTLATDAILHLIPAAFGLHSHGAPGEDDGHDHGDDGIKLGDYAQKGLLILAAFYAMYLLEVVMKKLGDPQLRAHARHSDIEASKINEDSFNETKMNDHIDSSTGIEVTEKTSGNQTCSSLRNIKPVAWMVLLGDGVHNFADGLAIGGAFSVSVTSGVSTSLAIFCHELPHELGDFAILLNSGFKPLAALFLNFLSALTAFMGLYVGLSLASDETAREWIFTLAAGLFLYISLADMLPELFCMLQKGPLWSIFIMENIGLLLGCLILVLLNLYEDHIQV